MNDQELRQMIRESIARHAASGGGAAPQPPIGFPSPPLAGHASFVKLQLARPPGEDWCLIEPSVRCNHCGYCLSYGH